MEASRAGSWEFPLGKFASVYIFPFDFTWVLGCLVLFAVKVFLSVVAALEQVWPGWARGTSSSWFPPHTCPGLVSTRRQAGGDSRTAPSLGVPGAVVRKGTYPEARGLCVVTPDVWGRPVYCSMLMASLSFTY